MKTETSPHPVNRWYDANIGRWISEDPAGFEAGDANLIRYVGNMPIMVLDPTGTSWILDELFGVNDQRRKAVELEKKRRKLLQEKAASDPAWSKAFEECKRQTPDDAKDLIKSYTEAKDEIEKVI